MKKLPIFLCDLAFCTLPALAQQRYILFPHFASGEGWTSDLFLGNQGSGTVSGIILSFWANTGSPMTVETNLGTGSNFTVNLPPGASQVIRVVPSTYRTGYIVLRLPATAAITATQVFRYEQGGTVLAELGVPVQSPDNSFTFPAEINSSRGVNTGVAFANLTFDSGNAQAQTLLVNLIRQDGTLQQTVQFPLGAGEQRALYLNEKDLFGTALDNFAGTISVSGANRFGVLALRQDKQAFGTVATDIGPVLGPFLVNSTAVPEYEPNNAIAQAQTLSGNTLVTGSIGTAGDVDYFKFTGSKGDVVTIFIDTEGLNSQLDSVIRLERTDGTIICQNDQNGIYARNDSFIQTVLPESGTFYIRVTNYYSDGDANHTYRLHTRLPGSGTPPAGAPVLNFMSPSSASQGTSIQLTLQGTNLSGTTSINFTPAAGVSVTNIQVSSGQVYAQVSIASDAVIGARIVSLTTPAGTSNALTFTVDQGSSGFNLNGIWTGTTSQGKSMSLTVANGVITAVRVAGSFTGTGCTAETETTTTGLSRSITNNSFSFSVNAGAGGISYTITGTFSSGTQASGSLNMTLNSIPGVPSCSGSANVTWSATKS